MCIRDSYSTVLPRDVELRATLCGRPDRAVTLNIPLVSSAMDTVTERETAIAMAQEGGLGVVHKNLTPAQQADEVRAVKKYEAGVVVDPITIGPDASVRDAVALMKSRGISGIPVVEGEKLVGIITHRDIRFEQETQRSVAEVMTRKLVTAREGVSAQESRALLQQHRIEKLLVVDEQHRLRGLITVKDIDKATRFPVSYTHLTLPTIYSV